MFFSILTNEEWYRNMNVIYFMSKYARTFRLGPLLAKDNVKQRLEILAKGSDSESENDEKKFYSGLNFCEFSYQLFQAYDWLYLFQNYGCRFQVNFVTSIQITHYYFYS